MLENAGVQRHWIKFPPVAGHNFSQAEAYFYLVDGDREEKIRFHDYDRIYDKPGLYEQIFYERLKCSSPDKVGEILASALETGGENFSELRVLDLGAGNGIMGDVLKNYGVARLIGADIIEEARTAADRDRPGVYDEYYVADFTNLSNDERAQLESWHFNCLTSVAALGFGDIPPKAFFEAMNLVRVGGWVAFNIKETFLDHSDESGFSRFVRELILSEHMDIFHLERYRHRYSMEGVPLYYFALVARKMYDIPADFLSRYGIEE